MRQVSAASSSSDAPAGHAAEGASGGGARTLREAPSSGGVQVRSGAMPGVCVGAAPAMGLECERRDVEVRALLSRRTQVITGK